LIFIFLYYFFSGLHLFINWAMHNLHHRPLASFSILSQVYSQQQPKSAKPNLDASVAIAAAASLAAFPSASPPVEKQKIKITIVAKKTSPAPVYHVPVPPATVSPAPAPVSPRTRKIKITIKKQPQKQEEEPQEKKQCFINDIAPPSSMIYNPCGDYIAPPPKCCRFFIDNRHCFLRSTDNACIDPITKIVFGFWNCEIGAKCKLLALDDDTVYEVCSECEEKQKENEDFCNSLQLEPQQNDNHDNETRAEMRKKSDANRSRLSGQPSALLRHKIAMRYGMHSFNSHGNRIQTK
jgi:hypothetical protein